MKEPHIDLAQNYFDYLAERFPVMCASDEFQFLPRAEGASRYYHRLDEFEADSIEETTMTLKEFQGKFKQLAHHTDNLEKFIDLELLKANVAGILIELGERQAWRYNPLIYLKIAFIGLDHAITKPAPETGERIDRTLARLNVVSRLLKQAVNNIEQVPETYHRTACNMLSDCKKYLLEIKRSFPDNSSGKLRHSLTAGLEKALAALVAFDKFLSSITPVPDQQFAPLSLNARLNDHFLSIRSLDEVFQVAVEYWWESLNRLEKLQIKIDPNKSWQDLYHTFCPATGGMDTISLYRDEIEKLRLFFGQHGFREDDLYSPLELTETPTYLRSTRGTASFSAAFSPDVRETSFFYITTHLPWPHGPAAEDLLTKRLQREYKFLTAHETVPGHHLLDSIRRKLSNPIRRQIESPLFYEGWASYAESLLNEYNYVNNPIEHLVDYKRRLWRSARSQIDIGLSTGMLDRADAVRLLTTTGFTREEALRQINRFQLNPGYQLCYTLGSYEIVKLKEAFGSRRGVEQFHTFLLEGGKLPFHLIEKRFAALDSVENTDRNQLIRSEN